MKNIYILGAAGSIVLQTLEVINEHPNAFKLIGISLGRNEKINHQILSNHQIEIVCLRDEHMISSYIKSYPNTKSG